MDIKIIGAGPGGLITGLKLLEAGFEPTIIDSNDEIKTTLCGEGLSKTTLEQIPFQNWAKYSPQKFDYATFILPGGYKAYANKECYTMDRLSWFKAMANEFEKQGGTLELGTKIKDINELKYDLLIGADGPFSIVARKIGNKRTHIPGVQTRLKIDYKFDGMEFFLNKKYSEEYSWIFAKGNIMNVGLLGMMDKLDEFIKDMGLEDAEVIDRLGFNIPFFGTKLQEGNIILTGDAAGITNPLTKGGMAAITYVAEILVDCLKNGTINEYQKKVLSHPVMAPEYKQALGYFKELDNKQLENLGKMVDGQDLLNLDKTIKLKIAMASITNPTKMKTLMTATRYASTYSW